jgi:long-chain acyl-CoA synthetase
LPDRPVTYRPVLIDTGVRSAAARTPGKVALAMAGHSHTYAQLVERIDRVADLAASTLGLGKGDRSALMAPNCLEFVEIVLGVAAAGGVTAMVNPKLTGPELAYICNDSGARVLFVHASLEALARATELPTVERIVVVGDGGDYEGLVAAARPVCPDVQIEEWDLFSLSYTAGTTGHPKGAMLSHRSRSLTFHAMAVEFGCYSQDDRALATAPLYHGAGFAFALAPIANGGFTEVGPPRYDPEWTLRTLRDLELTNVFFVPTHFNAIFALPAETLAEVKPRHLRTIISNAAPLPQATKEKIVAYFGEGLLHETYGSTEGSIVSNLRPPDQLRKIQCVGLPIPNTEVKLLDDAGQEVGPNEVGELFSRSPYLFNGYWGLPEATAESLRDGWFSAGDLAVKDDEGFIYIVDRKKDMIISGGVNIYPREIEEVLHHHPAVKEAACVGVKDEYWGEALAAHVVVRSGATLTEAELLAFCEGRLARYKLPKSITFIAELPRNAAGKVLRRDLREQENS